MASYIKLFCRKNIKFSKLAINHRSYSPSVLYIPGNKAFEVFSYLSPYLDYTKRLTNIEKLQNECNLRGIKINVEELQKSWKSYQEIVNKKNILQEKTRDLFKQCEDLDKVKNPSEEVQEQQAQLKQTAQLSKQETRTMKEIVWDIEESLIPQLLKIPSELDERTPAVEEVVLKTVGEKPRMTEKSRKSHVEIGKQLGLLDYRNPMQYYLSNEAALFELEALELATRVMRDAGFTRYAAPDFCRSIMVEGVGLDHENPKASFVLETTNSDEESEDLNQMHLMGGASLPSLLSIFTKRMILHNQLPARIFATGRQYVPVNGSDDATDDGLFSSCQTSNAQALILLSSADANAYNAEFNRLVGAIEKFYDNLGRHYRLVLRPVPWLDLSESLHLGVEMWSSAGRGRYVEVGHVSLCSDFFARRLMIGNHDGEKQVTHPLTLSATLMSVPRILGCLLEEIPVTMNETRITDVNLAPLAPLIPLFR